MDKIRVDGANGIRFSARKKNAFTSGTGSPFSGAFAASASESLLRIPKTDINPNKAVFTIDSKSSNILIVNNNACQLLGYRPSELCDMKFASLLTNKTNKSYVSALAEGQLNSEDGTMVLLSGKVVEMNTKNCTKVAVSLWIRQIDSDGRCLAVAEPVERRIAQLIVDKNGGIVSADTETLMLFQIDTEDDLIGTDVQNLIPAIQLPDVDGSFVSKSMFKQKATGKTKDNLSFPLCLMITAQEDSVTTSTDSGVSSANLYVITIWVFQNISGLVVIDETGSIELCNHHFSMLMFGYSQAKITRMHITRLIPNFGQEFEYLGNNRSRNITTSSLDNEENDESETETDPIYYEADQSFYATPTGLTASEYSKSSHSMRIVNDTMNKSILENEKIIHETSNRIDAIDDNKPADMSKAISEPIQICPNHFNQDTEQFIDKTAQHLTNEILFHIEDKNTSNIVNAVSKSNSENFLTTIRMDMKRNNDPKRRFSHNDNSNANLNTNLLKVFTGRPKTSGEKDDETNNCDGIDLLTPVNETDVSDKYILASDESGNRNSGLYNTNDIDEALNDINSDAPPDVSVIQMVNTTPHKDKNQSNILHKNQLPLTSTPSARRHSEYTSMTQQQQTLYHDGKYKGEAIHCDGNIINIFYTISSQDLPCGRKVYCVWICRDECDADEEDEDDGKHPNLTLTFNSITSNIESSVDGQPAKRNSMNVSATGGMSAVSSAGVIASNQSRPNSVSLLSQCEDEQISGEYNKYYTTLKQIGKGAFGYVKMAFRHTDRLLVVTKFILKEKLPPQFMVITEDKKEIPMEVYLLSTLKHPNIVTVLDVFENEKFFQLVMEKHGSGMDLFEFIDRRPLMDEQLGSYIFRQIVNAIDYLHSLKILHRDIKDENIIIDQYFHVKLIDFGSATFMEDGKLFSTFYGTTEYCSPEVLAGNKYAGPELEIWSLGVTLFVLIFFENPFIDIEETLHSELAMPHAVSAPLEHILTSMLDKNPKSRCTMKELVNDPWITQELNSSNFNFSWIVPCESHESNPDKYFTGQIYSSATGLSITSPHDSLSLADEEDSMIDADDDIEDDLEDLQMKHEFDYRKCRKPSEACSHKESEILDALNDTTAQTTNPTIINATTNTGKALQLPIAINKYLPQLNNTNCKRNHATNNFHQHQLESNKLPIKCPCSSASASASLANKISANATATATATAITSASIQNIQNIKLINNDIKSIINSTGKELSDICLMCEPNRCIKKESFSCDSINKSMYLTMIGSASNESLNDSPSDALHFECQDKSINSARSPKLSPHSGGSMLTVTNCAQSGTSSACNSPMISLSKSETNISETNSSDGGGGSNKFTIYNVVSLNDLYESDPFLNRPMNDLSKNQCLTKISDTELDDLNQKKHIMTLTNPKVLTTITVSMRNAADGSDKIF